MGSSCPRISSFNRLSVNGMVVKVGGDRWTAGHIVRRVLDRSKGIYLLSHWEYNNSSRMLAGGTAHAGTQPCTIRLISQLRLLLSPFLIIFLYISECRFIRQGTDGSCLEGLTFSENNLCIIMGLGLWYSPEKFKSISGSLSPLNPRKVSNGNVKALSWSSRGVPHYRADPVRHIAARHTGEHTHLISGESKSLVTYTPDWGT